MSKKGYNEWIIAKLGIKVVKSVETALAPHFRLFGERFSTTMEGRAHIERVPYANEVGIFMYVGVYTSRFLQEVGVVSGLMANRF